MTKNRHQEEMMGYVDIATSVLFVLLRALQWYVMFFFVVLIVGTHTLYILRDEREKGSGREREREGEGERG